MIVFRLGDAVIIEVGYQKHAPRAEVLGHNEYVQIRLRQQEVLYQDNPYLRLQEFLINQVVRRYDAASSGSNCDAS